MITAVGWQEMNFLTPLKSLVNVSFQRFHRASIHYPTDGSTLMKGRHLTGPNDIIDGQFVAEYYLTVFINVDDGSQSGIVDAEEIEKGGVLPEAVGVIGIVHAHFLIT